MIALIDSAPAFVVLDIMLPDGDGIQILQAIRDRKIPVRVAVVTGLGDPARLAAIAALNPDALLRKPIDISELIGKLGLGAM
jgi:two-component system, OmpR family, response regulator CpxR